MTEHEQRICVECVHYGDEDRKAVRTHVQCKASPYRTARHPVSGLESPYYVDYSVDSYRIFCDDTHHECREINFGTCEKFEAMEPSKMPETEEQGDLFEAACPGVSDAFSGKATAFGMAKTLANIVAFPAALTFPYSDLAQRPISGLRFGSCLRVATVV